MMKINSQKFLDQDIFDLNWIMDTNTKGESGVIAGYKCVNLNDNS